MPRRNARSLFPIVLGVPFAVLAFFAIRMVDFEYDALNARRAALVEERLASTGKLLSARLDLLGIDQLLAAREVLIARGREALRYFVLSGGVSFALAFDAQGRFFPPDDSDWLLTHKHKGLRVFEDPAQALRTQLAERPAPSTAAALVAGGEGKYTLLRCQHGQEGTDVCVTVDPAEVTSELKSSLASVAQDLGAEEVWLVTPDGYRLDGGRHEALAASISRPLSGLLSGWRIEANGLAGAGSGDMQTLLMLAVGGSLLAAWGAMAWGSYRSAVLREESATRLASVVAELSHELRTPLANLRLYVDLMERKSNDPAAVQTYRSVIDGEIGRLEQLAENAIDVGRGALVAQRKINGVPDETLAAVIRRFDPIMAAAGCAVHMTGGAKDAVHYDGHSFERIAVNLLDNARKYAPGSRIEVATESSGVRLRLKVRDFGPGVPRDERGRIFETLYRGKHDGVSGFGLGLATVRQLARQSGGDAWVEDAAPGACFCVEMQAERQPARQSGEACSC